MEWAVAALVLSMVNGDGAAGGAEGEGAAGGAPGDGDVGAASGEGVVGDAFGGAGETGGEESVVVRPGVMVGPLVWVVSGCGCGWWCGARRGGPVPGIFGVLVGAGVLVAVA